jgi:hypothetical protein
MSEKWLLSELPAASHHEDAARGAGEAKVYRIK